MRFALQDLLNNPCTVWSHRLRPRDEPAGGPLQMLLVRLWPMLVQGGETTRLVTALVRRHPVAVLEKLDRVGGQPDVDRLMHQGIGDTVEVVLDRDMVVDVDGSF